MPRLTDMSVPSYMVPSMRELAQSIIDDAVRLGLTWRLRPATVAGVISPFRMPLLVDGDQTVIDGVSMLGELLEGQRVWVLLMPPAGVYVIGLIGERVVPLEQQRNGRVKVQRIGNQLINNSSNTLATFTTLLNDDLGYWDNSGTFTVPPGGSGWYHITGMAAFAANSTGSRAINLLRNGTRIATVFTANNGSSAWREDCDTETELEDGDTVQMQVFQNSGGALNLIGTAAGDITTFSMSRTQPL